MDFRNEDIVYNLHEIDSLLPAFWQRASTLPLILFYGEMGAGKTTFISALCNWLGTHDAVSSPTFALINEYHIGRPGVKNCSVFHMDLYRLRSESEAITAGVEDCMQQAIANDDYVFVEWPEKAPGIFTMPHLEVRIELIDADKRMMSIVACNTTS